MKTENVVLMKMARESLTGKWGLALLCILTLGIGFFWLIPYTQVCMAKFYDDVKQ